MTQAPSSAGVHLAHVMLPLDDRAAQCARVADYIEAHPGCSTHEIAAAVDVGSVTKVISEMPKHGYVLRKPRSSVPCVGGTRTRRGLVRYYLDLRPSNAQRDLFEQPEE